MSAPFSVDKLLTLLDTVSPFSQAAAWDNVGLMVGAADREVSGILLALDPTPELLAECRHHHCNTIITHHPPIFHPLSSIRSDQPEGQLVSQAIKDNINLLACHTNLDVVTDGVSEVLARLLGVTASVPLAPLDPPSDASATTNANLPANGFGRYGPLATPLSGAEFLARIASRLKLPALAVAGPLPEQVATVAVCGGSGSDLARRAAEVGADIYITAEIKHATARWAESRGLCVVDAGHFATENPVVVKWAELIETHLAAAGHPVPVYSSRTQEGPFKSYSYHQPNS
ncbi:MAG: Nif3-like dinuclear metal center hexameric protein [Desulfurivibrio sp.]|nr:Nif3-like dinuclear metal center hexameric protein [Desulfurivibrio sp.]